MTQQTPPNLRTETKPSRNMTMNLFTEADVDQAINECNFGKAVGADGFNGEILKTNTAVRKRVCTEIKDYLNTGKFPQYFNEGRLVPMSKDKTIDIVTEEQIRPLLVQS